MRPLACARALPALLIAGLALVTAAVAAPGAPVVPSGSATSKVTAPGAPAAAALIPAAGDGVTRPGEPLTYAGDRLFDFIDGGAPQYMEYGFVEAVSQELGYHGRTYIFDVYRMTDPLAAFGVWSVRRPPRCTPLDALPRSCVTLPQAMLVHGPYYIEIAAYESVPETAAEMAELARRGMAGLDAGGALDDLLAQTPFTALPAPDRIAGSEKLARGPVSVRTGLGRAASGPLGPIVEALSAAAASPAPTWVIADYHAQAPRDPASAATTLVVLVGGAKTDALWGRARGALPAEAKVTLPSPKLWLAAHEASGQSVFGAVSGSDLVLGVSRLPAEALETWITQPALRSVQP